MQVTTESAGRVCAMTSLHSWLHSDVGCFRVKEALCVSRNAGSARTLTGPPARPWLASSGARDTPAAPWGSAARAAQAADGPRSLTQIAATIGGWASTSD